MHRLFVKRVVSFLILKPCAFIIIIFIFCIFLQMCMWYLKTYYYCVALNVPFQYHLVHQLVPRQYYFDLDCRRLDPNKTQCNTTHNTKLLRMEQQGLLVLGKQHTLGNNICRRHLDLRRQACFMCLILCDFLNQNRFFICCLIQFPGARKNQERLCQLKITFVHRNTNLMYVSVQR